MATVLDTGIINYLMPVFVFLFIFAAVFGVLKMLKIFGDNLGVNSVIAFTVALIFMISTRASDLVQIMTPWLLIFGIVLFFILVTLMFIGLKPESLTALAKSPAMYIIVLIIVAIIFFVSLAEVFSGAGLDFSYFEFLIHPKMVGVIVILSIVALAVKFISVIPKG